MNKITLDTFTKGVSEFLKTMGRHSSGISLQQKNLYQRVNTMWAYYIITVTAWQKTNLRRGSGSKKLQEKVLLRQSI